MRTFIRLLLIFSFIFLVSCNEEVNSGVEKKSSIEKAVNTRKIDFTIESKKQTVIDVFEEKNKLTLKKENMDNIEFFVVDKKGNKKDYFYIIDKFSTDIVKMEMYGEIIEIRKIPAEKE